MQIQFPAKCLSNSVVFTNGAGKTGYLYANKNEHNPYLTPHTEYHTLNLFSLKTINLLY